MRHTHHLQALASLVVDQTDTGRLAKMGLLQELNAKDFPFAFSSCSRN